MYIVLLRFAGDTSRAGEFVDRHNDWVERGFADGVFLMTGSLQPRLGGAILARDTSRAALERRVDEDPFVVEKIVTAEILELAPARTDDRLAFLLAPQA
jgi:uncharacterized protein YciI